MSRPHQELRPSQFITTYGPGSLLETRSGPVILKTMDELFRRRGKDPQDFVIRESRLSRSVLNGARVVRLPTNAELEEPSDEPIYPTTPFPAWALCTQHGRDQVLYQAEHGCPLCGSMPHYERRQKAGREAIRFVASCPEGHLDDVNWHQVVHGKAGGCKPNHYLWHGGGRSLKHVEIQCPQCKVRTNFGTAYSRPWPCSGRFPEQGPRSSGCSERARIFQRGASNLRMPVVRSALTILDLPAPLFNVLKDTRIITMAKVLKSLNMLNEPTFQVQLDPLGLPEATRLMLIQTPWQDLEQAIHQILNEESGTGVPLRDEEFDRLVQAATYGAPAVQPLKRWGPPLFEVVLQDVTRFWGPAHRLRFRVTPVSRLHMVMVQTGYQRVNQTGNTVPCSFQFDGQEWYPGIELFGEGLFIDLEGVPLNLQGSRFDEWAKRSTTMDVERPVHPDHVWWHTLAHRILQSLSIDSGYSSAAIRERIYLNFDSAGVPHGGVLLYTVQPGGDGTLGGLIALASHFDQILNSALRDIHTCSNDPLCEEGPRNGAEGAVCYSCLLASETSCEYLNLGLDRLLLVENMP